MIKSSSIRIDPHVAQMLDDLAAAMEKDQDMVAKFADSKGHISRSALGRECFARGYASLRQQVDDVPSPKPTKKPVTKAKKKARK